MKFHVRQSEKAIYSVFKITGPTGKIFIGCTDTEPEKFWNKGYRFRLYPTFFADIAKYGWDAFQKEIVCEKLLKEGAEKLEKKFIAYYSSSDPEKGYNT